MSITGPLRDNSFLFDPFNRNDFLTDSYYIGPTVYTFTPSGGIGVGGTVAARSAHAFVSAGGVFVVGLAVARHSQLFEPAGGIGVGGAAHALHLVHGIPARPPAARWLPGTVAVEIRPRPAAHRHRFTCAGGVGVGGQILALRIVQAAHTRGGIGVCPGVWRLICSTDPASLARRDEEDLEELLILGVL